MNIGISAEWLVAIFTGLFVVVTAGLTVYTYRLWGATDRLVTDAKDTSQRQLRATSLLKWPRSVSSFPISALRQS